MPWCIKCKTVRNLCISAVDRQGFKLDFTPDQSEAILFDHQQAAEFFASSLLDLMDPYDPDTFVVEPYNFYEV